MVTLYQKYRKKKHISVTELAKQLHTDKSNMYKILHKAHIDTELLYRISHILDYNFFLEYCQHKDNIAPYDEMELAIIKTKASFLNELLTAHENDIEILFKENK